MDEDQILERELHQIQQIRELDQEELQVEEVDSLHSSSDDDDANGQASGTEVTFNATLASLHAYLGEVEDIGIQGHRIAFLDGGAIFNLPLFYLEGVVLFPGAILPLRVLQPKFITVIERAMSPADAPYTIGVVRACRNPDNRSLRFANIGTTAEIRQYRRLEDGSLNVVTRGHQRFRVRRRWIDVDGAPCGEVQIIQEDLPLRTPRDAFGTLTPLSNLSGMTLLHTRTPSTSRSKRHAQCRGSYTDTESEGSFESELSMTEMRLHQSAIGSSYASDLFDEPSNSDNEGQGSESELELGSSQQNDSVGLLQFDDKGNFSGSVGTEKNKKKRRSFSDNKMKKDWITCYRKRPREVARAFWPQWVYRMYDSFYLAKRATDMWKQIVGTPNMDVYVGKPDILSFHIASKIPVSESTRQELLEIDGISYRLRREIELLENFDCVCCKNCKTLVGKRSDMLVMSSEGPMSAYVNPHGFVHETMTLLKANGLSLVGQADTRYSWFPGYAWTIAECANCGTHMGWLFTATKKKLKPKSFWGIRSCQVADVTNAP
ncbi:hypothetical protein V2J09_023469 [Rumex salicifolius]